MPTSQETAEKVPACTAEATETDEFFMIPLRSLRARR